MSGSYTKENIIIFLNQFIPVESSSFIADNIIKYNITVEVTKPRKSKAGDYSIPGKHKTHRITINNDLNPFEFLITFVHELAHLITFEKYGNWANPHGIQWQSEYQHLMHPLLFDYPIFPDEISIALNNMIINPSAATCRNYHLSKILKKYDFENSNKVFIEDLPIDTLFYYDDGVLFKKGEKLRKRYKCINLSNNSVYHFDPLAEVVIG